jgi:AbrB family looped-hinge helix DNA binding protein
VAAELNSLSCTIKIIPTRGIFMTTMYLSPKFQIVIPKEIRQMFDLIAGQGVKFNVKKDRIELIPELPMSAMRGMCKGIDTTVLNDPERV